MYDASDPRSSLASAPTGAAPKPAPVTFAAADVGKFYEEAPQEDDANGKSWFIRSQNAVLVYSDVKDGARFKRDGQLDEYVLLLPNAGISASVTTPAGTTKAPGYSVVFIPPGNSEIVISGAGRIVRLYTTRSKDLADKCGNAGAYETAHPNVPPFKPWPEPKGGPKVRVYSLDVPDEPGRFGRIWRCTTFMVNYLSAQKGPRDITKLSPHHHDDFEQLSLALEGAYIHHLRWPWTTNLNNWREDQHEYCGSPSVTVIPPPSIHTSRGMDAGVNQLVDIFSPPRMDFSLKPGWILNADDYPMPTNA
jgi:hypothetical protein